MTRLSNFGHLPGSVFDEQKQVLNVVQFIDWMLIGMWIANRKATGLRIQWWWKSGMSRASSLSFLSRKNGRSDWHLGLDIGVIAYTFSNFTCYLFFRLIVLVTFILFPVRACANGPNFLRLIDRGYQRVGENITKGKLDMQEAIDVSSVTAIFESPCHASWSSLSYELSHHNKHDSAARISNQASMEILVNIWKDLICGMFLTSHLYILFS
jgi:hypothetical protein